MQREKNCWSMTTQSVPEKALALAQARAEAFAKLQASPGKLAANQVAALAASAGGGGRGGDKDEAGAIGGKGGGERRLHRVFSLLPEGGAGLAKSTCNHLHGLPRRRRGRQKRRRRKRVLHRGVERVFTGKQSDAC